MGHVGLMPQSISVLGGFRPHGQSATEAVRVLREAKVCGAGMLPTPCTPKADIPLSVSRVWSRAHGRWWTM